MSIYDKASLVLIPSGTKTSKVYSQKPVNGDGDFTFSRSTAATRVNADGNIEKETQNLLLQSNFSSSWSAPVATMTGGQNGYDGSSDAWLLSATGNFARIEQTNSSNGVVTLSVYAKAGTADWIMLRLTGSGFNDQQYFDLANGTIGINRGCIAANIEDVGGGWYRCSATTSGPTLQYAIMYIALADGNLSPTNENIYIQDAQLEQGLVARDYIETTTAAVEGGITDNVPRLDYTDSSCPALLLEPQRTNSLKHSEYYATGGGAINSWTYVNSPVVTFNTSEVTSPEGLYNATKITGNGASGLYQTAAITGTCARSVYLRSVSGTTSVVLKDPVQTITSKTLNLTTEWTRYELIENNTAGASSGIWIDDISSGGIYMWGAQLEAGSYATSYIPTYGTSVTRNVDLCLKTGVSDLIGQTEGTLFVEINAIDVSDSRITISDGTSTNRLIFRIHSNGKFQWEGVQSGADQWNIESSSGTIVSGSNYKIAAAYGTNDVALYINGTQIGVDNASVVTSALNAIKFANASTGTLYHWNQYTKQALLFKTRLSNEELAALTTI